MFLTASAVRGYYLRLWYAPITNAASGNIIVGHCYNEPSSRRAVFPTASSCLSGRGSIAIKIEVANGRAAITPTHQGNTGIGGGGRGLIVGARGECEII